MSQEENPKYLYTPIQKNHLRNLKDDTTFPKTGQSAFANRGSKSVLSGGERPNNAYRRT